MSATSKATDLNNVRYLLQVADSGSFSAAARVLGVPPSLVSRKIAQLEEDVGARLFQRTTRSVALTDAGQAFLQHARAGMDSFQLAHELLGNLSGSMTGRVRLSAPVGASEALWATVSRFLKLYPDVTVEIDIADRYVDLVEERFDLAVRSGPTSRFGKLVGRRLVDAPRRLFASPQYLESRGFPRSVNDLKRHDCVILGPRAVRVTWDLHVGKTTHHVLVDGRVAVTEARLAAECAADGFGITFLPAALCMEHGEIRSAYELCCHVRVVARWVCGSFIRTAISRQQVARWLNSSSKSCRGVSMLVQRPASDSPGKVIVEVDLRSGEALCSGTDSNV